MTRLMFEVIGHPEPAGSKRAVPIRPHGGGWVGGGTRVIDANPKAAPWKREVAVAAVDAMRVAYGPEPELFPGPLGLAIVFTVLRPKSHYGTGRNANKVKDSAPPYPIVKPDATKLLRGVEDALTGVVWRDDAQVVEQRVTKRYGHPESAAVTIWGL